jgi:SAM-dependent methyltransferase
MISNKHEYEKMAKVELDHWWYSNLHHLVLFYIENHFHKKTIKIVDAGCGTGGLIYNLKKSGYKDVFGFDISEHAIEISIKRGLNVKIASLIDISKIYESSSADVIISNDTLYFLSVKQQDDFAKGCYKTLKKNGLLILNIPVSDAFKGFHDIAVGINHRFNNDEVVDLLIHNKFSILILKRWPTLLSLFIYLIRYKQRKKMKNFKNEVVKSDIDLPHYQINNVLKCVTKFENQYLKTNQKFGSSLFVVSIKK